MSKILVDRKVLEQALEALENSSPDQYPEDAGVFYDAEDALRAALERSELGVQVMNGRIKELAEQAEIKFQATLEHSGIDTAVIIPADLEKFAELIVQDYAKKTIQGLMSDPAFVQAMDEHYENKWSHRFD